MRSYIRSIAFSRLNSPPRFGEGQGWGHAIDHPQPLLKKGGELNAVLHKINCFQQAQLPSPFRGGAGVGTRNFLNHPQPLLKKGGELIGVLHKINCFQQAQLPSPFRGGAGVGTCEQPPPTPP